MTADQVVGVRANDMERQIEELKKKNSELETQIVTIKYVQIWVYIRLDVHFDCVSLVLTEFNNLDELKVIVHVCHCKNHFKKNQ